MKTSRWIVTVAMLLAICLASSAGVVPRQEPTPPVSPTTGPLLFQQSGCAQCHIIRHVGGRKGPELTHVGRRLKPVQIQRQILEGGDMMPPYQEALTPEDTTLLVKYLHKLR